MEELTDEIMELVEKKLENEGIDLSTRDLDEIRDVIDSVTYQYREIEE